MKYDVVSFSNRFLSKFMPKLKRYENSVKPERFEKIKGDHAWKSIRKSLDETEGYVFCGAVAIGFMQMCSLRDSCLNEMKDTRYMSTLSRTAASEATVVDYLEKYVFWHLDEEQDLFTIEIIRFKWVRKYVLFKEAEFVSTVLD